MRGLGGGRRPGGPSVSGLGRKEGGVGRPTRKKEKGGKKEKEKKREDGLGRPARSEFWPKLNFEFLYFLFFLNLDFNSNFVFKFYDLNLSLYFTNLFCEIQNSSKLQIIYRKFK